MEHDDHHVPGLRTALTAARTRRSRLLRRLGERALEILTEGGSLEPQDPKTQLLLRDVQKAQRELRLLEDRVRSIEAPHPSRPPIPGTDPRFPFSR